MFDDQRNEKTSERGGDGLVQGCNTFLKRRRNRGTVCVSVFLVDSLIKQSMKRRILDCRLLAPKINNYYTHLKVTVRKRRLNVLGDPL